MEAIIKILYFIVNNILVAEALFNLFTLFSHLDGFRISTANDALWFPEMN